MTITAKRTIVADLHVQTVTCTVCETIHEMPRRIVGNADAYQDMLDDIQSDHRECAEARPGQASAAAASRAFRKRVEHARREAAERRVPIVSNVW